MSPQGKKESKDLGTDGLLSLIDSISTRQDDLRKAEFKRVDEQMENMRQQARAESDRVDSIRKIDTDAVALSNERAAKQAELLAKTVADNAEVLRMSVEDTAKKITTQLQTVTDSLIVRISKLEKLQYEADGRNGISTALLMTVSGIICGFIVYLMELFI